MRHMVHGRYHARVVHTKRRLFTFPSFVSSEMFPRRLDRGQPRCLPIAPKDSSEVLGQITSVMIWISELRFKPRPKACTINITAIRYMFPYRVYTLVFSIFLLDLQTLIIFPVASHIRSSSSMVVLFNLSPMHILLLRRHSWRVP